jgi:hypothetical protein
MPYPYLPEGCVRCSRKEGPVQRAVVEIKPVDIDVGANKDLQKCKSRPLGRLRAQPPK